MKKFVSVFVFCVYSLSAQITGAPWSDTSSNIGASNLFNPLNAKTNFQIVVGNPNGQLAGTAGKDFAWNGTIFYLCTVTGNTATTVWTPLPFAALLAANNLSDVSNAATARTNLGLGSSATHPATDFQAAGAYATCSGDLNGSAPGCTVHGLAGVPFCNGFTPTNGQNLQYTTGGTPNPCYTSATPAGGGNVTATSMTANSIPLATSGTGISNSGLTQDGSTGQIVANKSLNGAASTSCSTGTTGAITINLALGNRCEVGTLTGNITSVTFTNPKPGLKFSVAYNQGNATAYTFTYGVSVVNNTGCLASTTLSSYNWQDFEIAADGSTIMGKTCGTNDTPNLTIPETGSPRSGEAGASVVTANGSTHRLEVNNNNTSRVQIVQAGADINTSDQVVSTHLTAPLPKAQGGAGADMTNVTFPSTGILAVRVASGTAALGTSAIASGACATVVTVSATGVATTDAIVYTPNADPTGVTGYAVSATGSLYIWAYPTTDNVNFKVCNNTAGSITPAALTLNWRVAR